MDYSGQHSTTGDQEWTLVVVENGRDQIIEEQMLRPPAEEFLSEIWRSAILPIGESRIQKSVNESFPRQIPLYCLSYLPAARETNRAIVTQRYFDTPKQNDKK